MIPASNTTRSSAGSNLSVNTTTSNLQTHSNLSSSFNSGLNTSGLNNSYVTTNSFPQQLIGGPNVGPLYNINNNKNRDKPIWLGHTNNYMNGVSNDLNRKATRLEALPSVDRNKQMKRNGPGPILNTMGTF